MADQEPMESLEACGAGELELDAALGALTVAFNSLGRVLLCLGEDLRIVHASARLGELIGAAGREEAIGRPAADLLGSELFGPEGALRLALAAGERREGWRGHLEGPDGERHLVSVTAAPLVHSPDDPCDPRVAHLVVLRPDQEEQMTEGRGPTVLSGLVARSGPMLRIFDLVESLRLSEATILITGESGTGKEVLARAIHETSPRRRGPFVAVNCAALPGELLETELFGHVRGAFTGAVKDRQGRFALAEGGTLFLDEVGDMPPALQVRLLRVLQERTYERVGEGESRTTNARIVAATNRNLPQAVLRGEFREDLFYRLRVVPIEIPPLRHRREDVEPLVQRLLARIGHRRDRSVRLSTAAIHALLAYSWPGNVRELENALEYAVAVVDGQTILPEHLPQEVVDGHGLLLRLARSSPDAPVDSPGADKVDSPESAALRRELDRHHWHRAETAEALGMSRTTLWRKMRELGLL